MNRRINFEPVSNLLHVQTRPFVLADPTLAYTSTENHLVDGEWVTFDAANKIVRASDVVTPGAAAAAPSWPLWVEAGRTDNQAGAEKKKSVLYLGQYEADTFLFNATSMAVGRRVAVATVTVNGRNYSGLVDNGTILSPGSGITVGIITRMPTSNGGKLRFRGGQFF